MAVNNGKALFDVSGAVSTAPYTFYAVANADFHVPTSGAGSLGSLQLNISTLADFQKIISTSTGKTHIKATAEKGLLMTGYTEITNVLSTTLTAADKKINLKRRVARFDVVNKETDGTLANTGGTNFKISAIYVSRANYAGYITAEASTGATIPSGSLDALTYSGTNDGVENKSVFYLWPTTLDKAQNKTVISIEGTFNGVKQVYVVKPKNKTTLVDEDLSIVGNYRYTLKVKRVDLTKIDFEIVVDKWNEGQDVTGEQTITATTWGTVGSELSNPTPGAGGVFSKTLDGTTNYEGSDATGTAVLQITSLSYRSGATDYSVTNYNGTDNAGTDIIVAKDETVTYAGAGYSTTYTITIPKQTSPVDRKITIADVSDPNNKKEIIIKANPKYLGTTFRPVLFKGIYWAPVNVGATKVDATTLDVASMGNVYQWGRSYASLTKASGLSGDELAGPTSLVNATTGTHTAKFILAQNNPYNWLDVKDDALWSGDNTQAVCPDGWRLPTSAELITIRNAWSADKFTANRLAIPGDVSGETLYLPAAGRRFNSTGASSGQGTNGFYWSSTVSGTSVYRLYFYVTGSDVAADYRAYGFSVRCVQK